ncbi:DUF4190 domain-containing protein [Mycolicibacterium komossense]|uniref:DUF4190 domain-containing protein n=1 Tax=Mycolicibacterium komossense TaxID=1779 RepID=A0ABT3CK21_9MYCO|nr:DUF4190 domain-containing protein [Mycolicibacterium komossense]MCV7229868.1 DUF4190 domain-containing protein [Mycolicibacterium komossense]
MIFPGGDSGETPRDERRSDQSDDPPRGTYEAPPIEHLQQPAHGTPSAAPGHAGPGYPPPGFPPPTYPYPPPPYAGGYPPPGYSGYAGYGPPGATGTNTMAIGSMVASVIGLLCGIGSIVGIALGFVALSQIKQSRQQGYGLAVAGIVVGVASLIISLIWMIYAVR